MPSFMTSLTAHGSAFARLSLAALAGLATFACIGLACTSTKVAPPAAAASAPDESDNGPEDAGVVPAWLSGAKVVVSGPDDTSLDCRAVICRHNENTDLVAWNGAIWFIHRTAVSQVLGPNSALHVYKSIDDGATFSETARIDAPADRDIRDPHFYVVGGRLHVKALARLAVLSVRDSDVDTLAMEMHSDDGVAWSDFTPIGPKGQSFWRIKEHAGTYFTAAYEDGDKAVTLFSSTDGIAWTKGPLVYGTSEDTPLETELVFMPSGKLLALVRMDGSENELLGDKGRLRTKVCWADAPYTTFDCPDEIAGQRLDGPVAFFAGERLFVIARKHLQGTGKKRTSLFEIGGHLAGGPLSIKEWGELPSAGDTSYAGVAMRSDGKVLVTWYSGRLDKDQIWLLGMIEATNVWQGVIDLTKL
jgi:hypothetical protein